METILITGGAGFIGKYFAEYFANNGFKIITVDLKSSQNANHTIKHYSIDITTSNLEQVFLENKIDYVIHLAAHISVTKSIEIPDFDATQNILGTINVIKYCQKYSIKKIIAASTAAVYGDNKNLPISESAPLNPLSPYGVSKLAMEYYIKISGLDYIIFRYSNIYGQEEILSKENCGVISLFFNKMKNNEDIIIYGDGSQTRDFIHIDDVAKINLAAIKSDTKNITVNFSTAEEITINQLFKTLAQITGYKKVPVYKEIRASEITRNCLDNSLALSIYGVNPQKFDSIRSLLHP